MASADNDASGAGASWNADPANDNEAKSTEVDETDAVRVADCRQSIFGSFAHGAGSIVTLPECGVVISSFCVWCRGAVVSHPQLVAVIRVLDRTLRRSESESGKWRRKRPRLRQCKRKWSNR